jgi:hypothetical protein
LAPEQTARNRQPILLINALASVSNDESFMRPVIKYGLLAVCLLVLTIYGVYFLFTPPKGYIYYFPENYAGWICIQHNVNGAAPLLDGDVHLLDMCR